MFISGSTCPSSLIPQLSTCLDFDTLQISHLLFVSKSITTVNAANLIPLATNAAYSPVFPVGATVTIIQTTLSSLAASSQVIKSPSIATEFPEPTRATIPNFSDCLGSPNVVTEHKINATSTRTSKTTAIMTGGALVDEASRFWSQVACSSTWNVLFVNCGGQLMYPVIRCAQQNGLTGAAAIADFTINYTTTKDGNTQVKQHKIELVSRQAFDLVPFLSLSSGAASSLATPA